MVNNETLVRDENINVKDMVTQRRNEQQNQQYGHGDYVPGANGEVGGIMIDEDEVLRKQTEIPQIKSIQEKLASMDREIENAEAGEGLYKDDNSQEQEKRITDKVNIHSPEMAAIKKVSDVFSEFEPSARGLAPKGSQEAESFKHQMADFNNGNPQPETNNDPINDKVEHHESHDTQNYDNVQGNITQFNVDSKNVKSFMNSLTDEELSKVVRSDTIIVNEIKTLDVPTTTRTITSLDEFKRILPKQSHSGVIETVLMNSGYVATFKGCGALAMATLVPNDLNSSMDYAKQYSFCYENLVGTSIGKLSFNEFCARTHVNDLSTCMLAILRASDPDENTIALECADCKNTYEVKYRLSELLDIDSITDEMNEQIEKIITAKDVYDNAMKVHQESPVMTTKYIQIDKGDDQKIIVQLKPTNGNIVIERFDMLQTLVDKYSRFVAGIIVYIPKIILQFIPEGESNYVSYDITDPYAIAEIIRDLDNTSIRALGQIMNDMTEYATPSYSFKGPYKCTKCGRNEKTVPCTIESLIFYRVEQAIR